MIEDTIISHLLFNEEYTRAAISHLDPLFFSDNTIKTVYQVIDSYIKKYNSCPSPEAVKIELSSVDNLNEDSYHDAIEYVSKVEHDSNTDFKWLLDQTEKFCQDKALYNAIMEAVMIYDGRNGLERGAIPQRLQDALAISFDKSIGHDYIEDFDKRYDFYHTKEDKIPFDLHYFNEITKGGISRKTLTIILAGTGVGKSLAMCHFAAANLVQGKNVLYITLEMAEEKIAERIDVNLMNVTTDDIAVMSRETFRKKAEAIRAKTIGKLVIKEYAPAAAGSAQFRALLNELRIKKNFVPDIIYIDYLNLALSSRIKMGSNVNSYTYIKAIAEELRGIGVEFNVPVVSATQVNRGGFNSSDVELTDTSESFGLPATADLMFAIISDEELEKMNQIMIKQLKNRYSELKPHRFVIGIDRSHMRFFDAEQSAQKNLMGGPDDDFPTFDKTSFGKKIDPDAFKDLF